MFVNGVEVISSKLNNINLDSYNLQSNMHPDTERQHVCGKNQLPLLHLTPSSPNQKISDGDSAGNNPYLLKPQHEVPPTPPPQAERKLENLFRA